MIRANRRITIDEVAEELGISHERAQNIIHDILRYRKVSARWVPRQLTSTRQEQRMAVRMEPLVRYHEDGNGFLFRIVTGRKRGSAISRQNRRPHLWSENIRHHLSERSSRQLPLQVKCSSQFSGTPKEFCCWTFWRLEPVMLRATVTPCRN
ncbi:histone-lysine N-methyltransferase SETMAR [Trichonephila clavata]|uniref:Histone-lysine N-methyltransferase SETMAR n=1 Tax=Trichonephila clavata TaxID=2740835 RepID=A0A8X6IZV9_TRICU|nr:histone-lysine N-methyltransferase SETMAR [Trichonephila clavata]